MKKQPGINGDYLILSRDERMALATLPTLVTLGTPAAVQTVYAFSPDMGPIDWALPLVLWIYGLLFWFNSEGIHLFKAKKWEWTEEAIEEQQRYMSDTRIASRRFWKKWWVRFPIGLLFMSVGIHALFSRDFTAQWLSFILLMSAFVTPFVFIAELAMLPLAILIVLGFMAVVTLTPTSVIIMLAVLAMFATVVLAQNVRASQLQKPVRKKKEDQETKDKEGEEGKDAEGATAGSNASAAAPVEAEAGPAMPPPPPSLADETAAAVAESAAAREEARAAAAEEREASVAAAKASAEERVAAAQSAADEAAQERAAARAELLGDAAAGTEADAAPPPTDTADTPVK
jgi:membrane protein implicated in regulation of membrane protease activity